MIKTILLILFLMALFFLAVMVIDNHRFVVRRYVLRSPLIRYPVKAVFIADLHEKDYGNGNEKLAEEIGKLAPDVIFVGGDLIVSGEIGRHYRRSVKTAAGGNPPRPDTEWMKNSLTLMRKLTKLCPVWFVRGNHEIRLLAYGELREYNRLFKEKTEGAGVRFLGNSRVDPAAEFNEDKDSGIRLQGLELPVECYKKFTKTDVPEEELERLLGKADPSHFTILLTHTPVCFEQYARWGADLCLCGHVHGGLMRLPRIGGVMGTRPNLFPKYSGGQYSYEYIKDGEKKQSVLIVTCGLGMHTLPIRIFNPGEISVIELLPDDASKN